MYFSCIERERETDGPLNTHAQLSLSAPSSKVLKVSAVKHCTCGKHKWTNFTWGGAVEWKLQLEFSVSFRPHCHRNTPWKAQKHRKLKVGEDLYLLGIPSPAPHGRPVHHPNFCSAALKPCCSSAQASARTLLCRMLRQSVYCVWSIGEHSPPQCWCEQG